MAQFFDRIPHGTGFGIFLAGVGLAAIAMMIGEPSGLHVPLWVAVAAASCFVFAGASVTARAFGRPRVANALTLGVVWGLAIPGVWIALGSDGSGCAVSAFTLGATAGADAYGCRLAFGAGSAIALMCALAMTWTVLHTRRVPEADIRRA